MATAIKERLTNFLNHFLMESATPLDDSAVFFVETHKAKLSAEILLPNEKELIDTIKKHEEIGITLEKLKKDWDNKKYTLKTLCKRIPGSLKNEINELIGDEEEINQPKSKRRCNIS